MELGNKIEMGQNQTLSPNQVQSLNILAYTNQELDEFLTNEYLENPLLESVSGKTDDMLTSMEHLYEKGTSYKDHYLEWEDEDIQRKNDIAVKSADELKEALLMQLERKVYSPAEWKLMEYMVECLDDDGFFPYEPAEIAQSLGYQQETVEKCLAVLKELEPVGVFSRDIAECLLKQAESAEVIDKRLCALIRSYMQEILAGRIGNITRELGISTAEVKKYIHLIGRLNPRPFMNIQGEAPQYIVPDVIIHRHGEGWEVILNDNWMGEYRYNDYYIRMMQEAHDEELAAYFKEKLERAKFVMNCVEQRRNTIIRIVEAILEIQKEYFENQGNLRPMSMQGVADKVGMHVSTVSRAIRGKYLQYKNVILIKELFLASVGGNSDREISAEKIKASICEIVRKEKKACSDSQITKLLQEKGIQVSRRTVAKYRTELGIPDSRQRVYTK